MKAAKKHQFMRTYAVLTVAAVMVLGLGVMAAASDRNDNQSDRSSNQVDRSRSQQQYGQQGQNQWGDQSGQGGQQVQGRNMQLERQIAAALRQAGYGAQGEIMILATGEQVTLLGTVPSDDQKNGAEQIAKGVARGLSVKNRLHADAQARQMNDNQLRSKITDELGDDLQDKVQVSVQNGTATLQGQVDDWNKVADAIDAAFAAGASRVNSQFTVGAGGTTAPSYGYIPGQQAPSGQQGFSGQQGYSSQQGYSRQQGSSRQQGAMGGAGQASSSDLRLAQQVANQLRQQLPPGQNVQLIQPQSIYVSVSQGTVTLHGYVQNNNQKQQAQQIIRSIRGVQNVRNDLQILSTASAGGQMGSQSQYGQGSSQQGFGGQSQYGQSGAGSQQGFGGQSQYGQGGTSSQPSFGGQSQYDQSNQQGFGGQSQYDQSNQQGFGGQSQYDQRSQQGFGGQNQYGQGGSYQPQGYIPGQSGQAGSTQQGSSQSQYGQSGQNSQSQYGQNSQQGFGGQSQSGQSSQMGGGQGDMTRSDMALAQQVTQQLKQQLTSIQNIQVMRPGTIYIMAVSGNVMLHGFVTNPDIKQQVSQIAKAVPGVRNVTDTLHIIGGAGAYPSYGYVPGQSQSQQGSADQSSAGQGMGQQSRSRQGSGARPQYIAAQRDPMASSEQSQTGWSQSDMTLARQVVQKLWQQPTGFQNIQIMTPGTIYLKVSNGTITLEGFVQDNNAKQQIEQLARSISGVQNVRNSLNVAAGGQALGFMPADQDQSANQDQQFDDQDTGRQFGDQQSDMQSGADEPDTGIN